MCRSSCSRRKLGTWTSSWALSTARTIISPSLFNILELKARIRALLRRSASGKKKTAEENRLVCGHISLDRDARNAYNDGRLVELTAKEFDVIELLMRNPNRVYSRDALLSAVWGDSSSDIRTVDVHIRRLREKLERDPAAPEYILTKWGGATISSTDRRISLIPSSSQLRNALVYVLITSVVLLFLNLSTSARTRRLMLQAKICLRAG